MSGVFAGFLDDFDEEFLVVFCAEQGTVVETYFRISDRVYGGKLRDFWTSCRPFWLKNLKSVVTYPPGGS